MASELDGKSSKSIKLTPAYFGRQGGLINWLGGTRLNSELVLNRDGGWSVLRKHRTRIPNPSPNTKRVCGNQRTKESAQTAGPHSAKGGYCTLGLRKNGTTVRKWMCWPPEIFRSTVSCGNDNLPPSAEVLNQPRPSSEGTRLNSWPWIPSYVFSFYSSLCLVSYVIYLFLFVLPNSFTVFKVDYFDLESI